MSQKQTFPDYPLAELHAHLGTSIRPSVLWEIAHQMGYKLPKRDFNEFRDYITLSPERKVALNTYFREIYHPVLDKLSSGSHAVEFATYHTMTGAYRNQGITLMELRNGPLRHNRDGEFDLDQVIMSMLRGMERALLECRGLNAGLIFCMLRDLTYEQNVVTLEKAIKYHRRGVVGIDLAGPGNADFNFKDYTDVFKRAKKAGLKVTVHSGEQQDADDMWEALECADPLRIGHGIRAAYDKPLMKELAKRKTVLEVCPLSNVATKAVENMDELKFILRTFIENDVRFCINTDWPETIENNGLRQQYAFLLEQGMLSEEELEVCTRTAFEASFIPKGGGLDAYL